MIREIPGFGSVHVLEWKLEKNLSYNFIILFFTFTLHSEKPISHPFQMELSPTNLHQKHWLYTRAYSILTLTCFDRPHSFHKTKEIFLKICKYSSVKPLPKSTSILSSSQYMRTSPNYHFCYFTILDKVRIHFLTQYFNTQFWDSFSSFRVPNGCLFRGE